MSFNKKLKRIRILMDQDINYKKILKIRYITSLSLKLEKEKKNNINTL